MTDKLTIAAYRCNTGGTQITLSQTNEDGLGWGRRLAGPKHYNLGTKELVSAELDESDAAELRRMLDAVFPGSGAAEVERLKAELAKYVGKEPTVAEEMAYVSPENTRLTAEAEQLRANAQKLAASWRQSSDEHSRIAGSPELLDNEGMTNRQRGRAVQLADCAFDLEGVLGGEDPDGWTHGIAITVADAEPASS